MPTADGLTEPKPILEKKVYPPLQWRPLRVMNPWQKFGFLVAMLAVTWVISGGIQAIVPGLAGAIASQVVSSTLQVALARSFRGFGEPVAPPRAWWRLTARPLAGWWLSGMNLFGSLSLVTPGRQSMDEQVVAVAGLLLGLAFLNSSIRLTAQRRQLRHPQI